MITIKKYDPENKPNLEEKRELVNFLFEHLENFGDPKTDIEKAINYSIMESPSFGGFVLASFDECNMVGAVVINQTGMKDYIPENILVYIATHRDHRGIGIGKQLMLTTIGLSQGNIALHVEPDNPARFLYEKVGFVSKYKEMRLIK